MLYELKKEIEHHVVAVVEDVRLSLDEVKTKMQARVQKHDRSFSGSLYPQSLLVSSRYAQPLVSVFRSFNVYMCVLGYTQDRLECGSKLTKRNSCLLQFGELERFEALMLTTSARNNQSVDLFGVAEAIQANEELKIECKEEQCVEGRPLLSVQIAMMHRNIAASWQSD